MFQKYSISFSAPTIKGETATQPQMTLNPEIFTEKTSEALNQAKSICQDHSHSSIHPLHIIDALFNQENSLLTSLVNASGADPSLIQRKFKSAMLKLPIQTPAPSEVSFHQKALNLLNNSQTIMKNKHDSHLAIDHLILALFDDSDLTRIFSESSITKNSIQIAINQIRGSRHVDSKTADSSYEALSKYAIDLVEQAAKNKLDPVIGRDEEIRRVIQILVRRTKNNPVLIGEPGMFYLI